METYKGNARCSCGMKAKWRDPELYHNQFACDYEPCKQRLISRKVKPTNSNLTEADYQTWMQL